jgi:hypothetical protein
MNIYPAEFFKWMDGIDKLIYLSNVSAHFLTTKMQMQLFLIFCNNVSLLPTLTIRSYSEIEKGASLAGSIITGIFARGNRMVEQEEDFGIDGDEFEVHHHLEQEEEDHFCNKVEANT